MEDYERIMYADNHGEHMLRIGKNLVFLDGFGVVEKKVCEFLGCFYHGCPRCFHDGDARHAKLNNHSMHEVYDNTFDRIKGIQDAGYPVKYIWECKWKKVKKSQPAVQQFVERLDLTARLNPRDGFYGGRTNAAKLYPKVLPGEEIRHVDFTSLYPHVNKSSTYPLCHPIIIT